MREKIEYEVDPHNRLIASKSGTESGVKGFRYVLDGRFKIDNNILSYHLKKSQNFPDIPQQIKLSGAFSLDKDNKLIFTLDKWNNQAEGNRLIISADIIGAKSNELAFSIITKNASGDEAYLFKLSGFWQADDYNRLGFNVMKENGAPGRFTLEGIWEINKNHQIVYSYISPAAPVRKREKDVRKITLKGFWDITERNKISYVLNKEQNSQFDFKISLANAFKHALVYEVAIGVVPEKRVVALSGNWRINPRLGLIFDVEYEDKKAVSIIFGAECQLAGQSRLEFKLKDRLGRDLGIEIGLSKSILKNQGEAFIKALLSRKEASLVAGVGFRW